MVPVCENNIQTGVTFANTNSFSSLEPLKILSNRFPKKIISRNRKAYLPFRTFISTCKILQKFSKNSFPHLFYPKFAQEFVAWFLLGFQLELQMSKTLRKLIRVIFMRRQGLQIFSSIRSNIFLAILKRFIKNRICQILVQNLIR